MKISFNRFVDYVSLKKQKSKVTFIRNVKENSKYKVEQDFYKPLRECIIRICKQNKDISELDNLQSKLSDSRKKICYISAIQGFKSFLKSRKYKWINPERISLNFGDLEVVVNPELGLEIGDTVYFIKLYFKKEKINKEKVNLLIKIMQESYKDANKNFKVAVLDVRNGTFYSANLENSIEIPVNIKEEADCWNHIWENIEL